MSIRALTVLPKVVSSALVNVNSVKIETDEYINCGNVTMTTDISVFAWVRYDTATSSISVVTKWEASDSERSFVMQTQDIDSSKFQVLLSGNGTTVHKNYRGSQTAVQTSAWHHIGFTFAGGSDTLTLYVDGASDGFVSKVADSSLGGAIFSSAANLCIGAVSKGAGGLTGGFFDGYIDQVTIFDKVLSGAEVTELYGAGEPPDARTHSAASDLVHYWPIGEGSDTNTFFEDYAGSNDGTGVNIESGDIQTNIP